MIVTFLHFKMKYRFAIHVTPVVVVSRLIELVTGCSFYTQLKFFIADASLRCVLRGANRSSDLRKNNLSSASYFTQSY